MIRAGLRRILIFVAVVLGGTAAISVVLGALAGGSIHHALAVGFYLAGAGILFCSLALGSRGPMRVDRNVEEDRAYLPRWRRSLRKATPDERTESRRVSLGLFAFGLLLVLLGVAIDPSRRVF